MSLHPSANPCASCASADVVFAVVKHEVRAKVTTITVTRCDTSAATRCLTPSWVVYFHVVNRMAFLALSYFAQENVDDLKTPIDFLSSLALEKKTLATLVASCNV